MRAGCLTVPASLRKGNHPGTVNKKAMWWVDGLLVYEKRIAQHLHDAAVSRGLPASNDVAAAPSLEDGAVSQAEVQKGGSACA